MDTKITVPDPCSLISSPLSEELIGAASGTREKEGDSPGNTQPSCNWKVRRSSGTAWKEESIAVHVSATTKRLRHGDKFLAPKAAYNAHSSGKSCKKIQLPATESCWYHNANFDLALVLRKEYVVAWAYVTGEHSPALRQDSLEATAQRMAADIDKGLSQAQKE
ncbi:hypothetical protein [Spirillospora sp. NPDC029432]|uniref:hypothetical protein n=1 Tax=Spirillospora sp. NPDC029432 TaxID=3154599 RepID=UPI003454FAAC